MPVSDEYRVVWSGTVDEATKAPTKLPTANAVESIIITFVGKVKELTERKATSALISGYMNNNQP
jgi:hypothetical protein